MQISAVLGVLVALFAIIGGNIMEGGNPLSLVALPPFVIVVIGTIGATLLSVTGEAFQGAFKAVSKAFKAQDLNPGYYITLITSLAEKARREGLLSLESENQNIKDEFLRKGIELVVDGTDPEVVSDTLRNEIYVMEKRHETRYHVWETMGGYSPTLGVLGTVMGLISVMGSLDQPDKLGPKIALAFIATFYGVAFANLFFLPLGTRLKKMSQQEALVRELIVEGVLALQAGENPRVIQQKLLGFLAPSARAKALDGAGAKAGAGVE